jgi:hypothetical protein
MEQKKDRHTFFVSLELALPKPTWVIVVVTNYSDNRNDFFIFLVCSMLKTVILKKI